MDATDCDLFEVHCGIVYHLRVLLEVNVLPVRRLIEVLSHVSHAAGHSEPLAQGARAHVDEGQTGGRVALEVAIDLAQVVQQRHVEVTGLGPGGVQDWGGVTLQKIMLSLKKSI